MELLFDPSKQVGSPTLLLIERIFYLGLAIFLIGALVRSIITGIKEKED